MSFIQSTIKCKHCGKEMNIALGTFGYGYPKKCPRCNDEPLDAEEVSAGWNAKDSSKHKHNWKSTGGGRFDESFECTGCSKTKYIHEGITETIIKYGKKLKDNK